MRRARKRKKHRVVFQVKTNEKLSVFDLFSRFDFEVQLTEEAGRTYLNFLCPYSMRFARGGLS